MSTTKIVTSNWFAKLPDNYLRIGISRGVPRGLAAGFRRYTALNPGTWFDSCATPREYMIRYQAEVLGPLDPEKVVADLQRLAGDKVPALLCFEGPEPHQSWCHRGLVSAWLKDTLDLDVFEFGQERYGCGWQHPKLDPSLRKGPSIEEIERSLGFQTARPKRPTKGIGAPRARRSRKDDPQGQLL
jgi:hypothetical protein